MMNKRLIFLKPSLLVSLALLIAAALLVSGCERTRYPMGKTIVAPKDEPAYTEKAIFQPPASTSIN